jgi:hypothetical protein
LLLISKKWVTNQLRKSLCHTWKKYSLVKEGKTIEKSELAASKKSMQRETHKINLFKKIENKKNSSNYISKSKNLFIKNPMDNKKETPV